jgi:hypothetical protein
MRKLLNPFVVIASLSLFAASWAQAAWIGVLLYSPPFGSDHIHMSVSDDNFNQTKVMNVWDGETYSSSIGWQLKETRKFLLFKTELNLQEVSDIWNAYFHKVKDDRSILGKNCAYSTDQMLQAILHRELHKRPNVARLLGVIKVPNFICPIRLPGSVFKQAETTLQDMGVAYATHKDLQVFFKEHNISEKLSSEYGLFANHLRSHPPVVRTTIANTANTTNAANATQP